MENTEFVNTLVELQRREAIVKICDEEIMKKELYVQAIPGKLLVRMSDKKYYDAYEVLIELLNARKDSKTHTPEVTKENPLLVQYDLQTMSIQYVINVLKLLSALYGNLSADQASQDSIRTSIEVTLKELSFQTYNLASIKPVITYHLEGNTIVAHEKYIPGDIQSLVLFIFGKTITNNIPMRECGLCKRFFIPANRSDEMYCDRIYKGKRTCKQSAYELKDSFTYEYRKHYKKNNIWKNKHKDNPNAEKQFKAWVQKANILLDKAKTGEISLEELTSELGKPAHTIKIEGVTRNTNEKINTQEV